ncbi:hypothetical protein ABW21_db0206600 [Orbilia brochopaga]|nr:hypothetical protein ABW21_db0206600 [Drechslerella brochopaga]
MALSLSSPDSPAASGFDRTQRLSNSNSKPVPLANGIKVPDAPHNGTIHQPNGLTKHSASALLEIPIVQANGLPSSGRTSTRSPKDKQNINLPTIRTEGPSPTSAFNYTGRGTIKEARSRRRKPWRKLMWVKQNYPDNYTDATFLETLQRNANFRAYDFWSLVYDTTVITQHLATVVVFVCAFIAISKERIEPVYVAGASTILTIVGWLIWDEWNEEEQKQIKAQEAARKGSESESSREDVDGETDESQDPLCPVQIKLADDPADSASEEPETAPMKRSSSLSPKKSIPTIRRSQTGGLNPSVSTSELNPDKLKTDGRFGHPLVRSHTAPALSRLSMDSIRPPSPPPPLSRANRRLSTLKSAVLIYSTLLGLSPILKSLTKTTTSDSIWALSSWLFLVNLLCFDYGLSEGEADGAKKGVEAGIQLPQGVTGPAGLVNSSRRKLPTSLSTTTALAASVVLASRLAETSHVFSLLLFSIQLFGLFPLFRRRLRHLSSLLHIGLTAILIIFAGTCLHFVVNWHWALMWFGLVVGGGGGAAWVLMGMQRYKNEIRGPWDPARPVFSRRQWMD